MHVLLEHHRALEVRLPRVFDDRRAIPEEVATLVHEPLEDVTAPDVVVAAELPAVDPEVGQEEVRRHEVPRECRIHAADRDVAERDVVLRAAQTGMRGHRLASDVALDLVDAVEVEHVLPHAHVHLHRARRDRLRHCGRLLVAVLVWIPARVEAGLLDRVDPRTRDRGRVAHDAERAGVPREPPRPRPAVVVERDDDVRAFLVREVVAEVARRGALVRLRAVVAAHDPLLRGVVEEPHVRARSRRELSVAVVDDDDRDVLGDLVEDRPVGIVRDRDHDDDVARRLLLAVSCAALCQHGPLLHRLCAVARRSANAASRYSASAISQLRIVFQPCRSSMRLRIISERGRGVG